jgi:hypothetical protein
MLSTEPYSRSFALESATGVITFLFGVRGLLSFENDALHRIVALYLTGWGCFLIALSLRRRNPPSSNLPQEQKSGLQKALDKLSEPKPFGFTCLAISPLLFAYGGFSGFITFCLMYFTSVLAMRVSDTDLAAMVKTL